MISADFSGKTAVITGSTGGIGMSISEDLVRAGVAVILSGTNSVKLEAFANILREKFPSASERIFIQEANFGDESAVRNLIFTAAEKFGKLDFLVANAGLTRDNLSISMKMDEWQDVINVNLTSSFILAQEATKVMMRKRFGRVVFVTSVIGKTGNKGQVNYAASKAGIIALAKSFAQEYASRNITFNCIAPGFIETPMTASLPEAVQKATLARIPLARFGTPKDISDAIMFLLSACYITGETLNVNGGMLMD